MQVPLVTVIIPTHNVERYIDECLESLLNQSYNNIEIIVLDDASTDTTVYLLEKYINKIQLIKNTSNKGQGYRRNEGINLAKGKYIYFLDSDDWIEPETIEHLVEQAENTKSELVRFNGKAFYEGDPSLIKEGNYNFSNHLVDGQVYQGDVALKKNRKSYSASPCLYLTVKSLIKKNDINFLENVLHEDEYFTTLLFLNTNKFSYLNKDLYHRRYRNASTMTLLSEEQRLKSFLSYLKIFKALEEEYLDQKYSLAQKKFIKRRLIALYNNLLNANIPEHYKVSAKHFKTITLFDKLFLKATLLKKYLLTLNKKIEFKQ